MKRAGLVLALLANTAAAGQQHRYSLDDLAWFVGCWSGVDGDSTTREQWVKPSRKKTMLGVSRTIADGKTVEYESMRLHEEPGGDIFYTAHPSGQKEASFKLVRLEGQMAVFENPEHDFPQRIIYRLESDGTLNARIEGKSKGKERSVDFPMKRVGCE